MGGLCSRRANEDGTTSGGFGNVNGHFNYGSGMVYQSRGLAVQANSNSATPTRVGENADKQQLREPFSFPDVNPNSYGMNADDINDGIPRLPRALSNKSRSTKSNLKVCLVYRYVILFMYFASVIFGSYILYFLKYEK